MKSFGRKVARLIPALLTLLGLLWPLIFSGLPQGGPVSDPVVFTNLRAQFTVDADGLMHATETITATFPSGRHGIFRFWDVGNPNDSHVRQVPEVAEITLDGHPIPYEMSTQSRQRFVVAKIGDPGSYLGSGTHVFVLRYDIPGVLDPGATGAQKQFASVTGDTSGAQSAFFWNVIAPGWSNEIERAEVVVTLPASVPGAQCSVGEGIGRACESLTVTGNTVELSAANLPPRTPVTVRAGVQVQTPPRATLPWPLSWDRILGRSVPVVLWLLGLTVTAGLGAFLWWRSTVEPEPGFPLQYAPPPGLGPVQCEFIRTESVPEQGLTATLFHLADRGLLSLNQGGGKKWTVQSVAGRSAWAGVDPVSESVGSALGLQFQGNAFAANGSVTAGRKLSSAKIEMEQAVNQWAFDEGLMVKRRIEFLLPAANIVALVLAVCGFVGWFFPITLWGLPFAVFFLLSSPAWGSGVGQRRTPAGRQLWSQVGGFHRMLATDSAEARFDFSARKDLYTSYIPFAVAGGAAAVWAAKYKAATGQLPPDPGW